MAISGATSSRLWSGQSFLERLGFLYERQIRLTIIAELGMREMSPKQFFEEIGGSSYANVHRQFQKLTEYGWLRKVRSAPLKGPGRPEHLYRATELAVIDDETWAQIPVSIRDAFTIQLIAEVAARLDVSAAATGTGGGPQGFSHFERLVVDTTGWHQAIDVVNSGFRVLSEEQIDAKVRLDASGSEPSLWVITLAGFELAGTGEAGGGKQPLPIAELGRDAPEWGHRVAKVFSDWRNLKIIEALNAEPMSPRQLFEQIGGASVEGFEHRCRQLVDLRWVVRVGDPGRNATENLYRATLPDTSQLKLRAPTGAHGGASLAAFDEFCQASNDAMEAGTFNGRDDRHLTLSTLLLDDLGAEQVARILRTIQERLIRIRQESQARLQARQGSAREFGALISSFENPFVRRP